MLQEEEPTIISALKVNATARSFGRPTAVSFSVMCFHLLTGKDPPNVVDHCMNVEGESVKGRVLASEFVLLQTCPIGCFMQLEKVCLRMDLNRSSMLEVSRIVFICGAPARSCRHLSMDGCESR